MKKGDVAELKMKRWLHKESHADKKKYGCRFWKYDAKQERIYLVLQSEELEELSLDAIYEGEVRSENEGIRFSGRIKERYDFEDEKMVEIQIENGFYKINLKCVDK